MPRTASDARHTIPTKQPRTVMLTARVTPETRALLAQAAERRGQSLSTWIADVVTRAARRAA